MRLLTLPLMLLAAMYASAAFTGLSEKLKELIGNTDAGISLITPGGDAISIHGDEFYDLASVVKFYQAAALAKSMDFDSLMNTSVQIIASDLHPDTWSPMRARIGTLPYESSMVELLDYSLNFSDNNAADILFDRFLSPSDVEDVLRKNGLVSELSIRSTEAMMHADGNRIPNLATPNDAARCIYRFFTADTTASATLVKAIMARDNPFGKNRIPAGVADGETKVFHKTGTGFDGVNGTPRAINDLAFISYKRPGGYSCYALAVFLRDFQGSQADGEALIAEISRYVWSAVVVEESIAMNAAAASRVPASKVSKTVESPEKFSLGELFFDAATHIIYNAIDEAIDRKLSE